MPRHHHHHHQRSSTKSSTKSLTTSPRPSTKSSRSIELPDPSTPASRLDERLEKLENLKTTMLQDRLAFDDEDIGVLEHSLGALMKERDRLRKIEATALSAPNGLEKVVDAMTAVLAKRQAVLESADEVMMAEGDLLVFFSQKQAFLENQKNQVASRLQVADKRM